MIGHDGGHEQARTRITDPQVMRALVDRFEPRVLCSAPGWSG
jgi:hypothetical protein